MTPIAIIRVTTPRCSSWASTHSQVLPVSGLDLTSENIMFSGLGHWLKNGLGHWLKIVANSPGKETCTFPLIMNLERCKGWNFYHCLATIWSQHYDNSREAEKLVCWWYCWEYKLGHDSVERILECNPVKIGFSTFMASKESSFIINILLFILTLYYLFFLTGLKQQASKQPSIDNPQ